MFFDRSGKSSPSAEMIRNRRRQWAALGLAAAMATPPGALQFAAPMGASRNPAAPAPATQPSETTPSKAAVADALASMTPKQHYQLARELYRHNDWASARQHFEAARAGRYRPGLFEGDSPAVYLGRMDKKERADREAAARAVKVRPLALAEQAVPAPEAPTTAPATTEPAPPAAVAPADLPPPPPAAAPAQPLTPAAAPVGGGVPANQQALQDLRATAAAEDLRRQQAAYQANQLVQQAQRHGRTENSTALVNCMPRPRFSTPPMDQRRRG